MRIDLFGLVFETPGVTFYLWSPWRATQLEHRLFESLKAVPHAAHDREADEWRLAFDDPKAFQRALQTVSRVLKGWQEDAEAGSERRSWRWLLEADTDADGYDHTGELLTLWGFLRLSLDRSSPGEEQKGEDVDLDGFGLRIWGERAGRVG